MKTSIFTFLIFCLFSINCFAYTELPEGSAAPNFIATDINGDTYELYDLLEKGKTVFLDFSTTWCGPCWSFKEAGTYNLLNSIYGPDGTDEVVVLFIESDFNTTMDDLLGLTEASLGNWIEGATYPIIDNADIASKYQVVAYPTVLSVCPDRKLRTVSDLTSGFVDAINNCPESFEASVSFISDERDACGALEVSFNSDTWPKADSWFWDFGDGNTSTEENPKHIYNQEGSYDILLKTEQMGQSLEITKEQYVNVGDGYIKERMHVGPADNNFGEGGMFQYGASGLIFDVYDAMILESVTVYAEFDEEKIIAVTDIDGNLIAKKQLNVTEGKNILKLNFYIEPGKSYKIYLQTASNLYRNRSGAIYPYTIDGLVSIEDNNLGIEGLYYFFYDWVVREAGCADISNLEPSNLIDYQLYPNPTSNILNIEGLQEFYSSIEILDIVGRLQSIEIKHQDKSNATLDVSSLSSGIYFIKLGKAVKSFIKQ